MPKVVADDGIALNYEVQGKGPDTVLLLHGWGGSSRSWQSVLQFLDNTRFRWIVPDFRGHGGSSFSEGDFSSERFSRDLLLIMNAENVERAAIVGFSGGCRTGVHLARFAPSRVSKLVLAAPSGFGMSPVPRDFMMSLCETAADRAKLRPLFDDWCKKKGASWIESYLDDTVSIPTKALKGVSEMWMYTSMSEEASRTSQPTLVLIGIYDPVYSLEFQKDQTLQALPAAKISMIDSGHFMPLELPEQLAKEIDDFLKS